MQSIQIIAITFSLSILIAVIDLIRRGKLKEQYALLWLASGFILLILSLWRDLLHKISNLAGVAYPPALLFFLAFLFLLVIVLHFSVVISDLSEKNKRLAQEIGLLKARGQRSEVGDKAVKEGEETDA